MTNRIARKIRNNFERLRYPKSKVSKAFGMEPYVFKGVTVAWDDFDKFNEVINASVVGAAKLMWIDGFTLDEKVLIEAKEALSNGH